MRLTTREIIRYYRRYKNRGVDIRVLEGVRNIIINNQTSGLFTPEEIQELWEIYMSMDVEELSYSQYQIKLGEDRKIWRILGYKGFIDSKGGRWDYHNTIVLHGYVRDMTGRHILSEDDITNKGSWVKFQEVYSHYIRLTNKDIPIRYKKHIRGRGEMMGLSKYLHLIINKEECIKEHHYRELVVAVDNQINKYEEYT